MYSLYTFIDVYNKPKQQISLIDFDQFPQIAKIMQKIILIQQEDFRQIYQLLYQFLAQQEQNKGPKRFHKLIQSIVNTLILHSKNQLEINSPQNIILNLTYFQKYCSRFQNISTKAKFLIIFAICNWKMNLLDISMIKIQQSKKILSQNRNKKNFSKAQLEELTGIIQILQGIVYFKMDKIKAAQIILTKVVNQCTSFLTSEIKVKNFLSNRIVKNLSISLYFLSQIHHSIGKNDQAAYQLTKSVQLAKEYLNQQAYYYVQKVQRQQYQKKTMAIKLSRTQSKIQEISMIKRHKILYKRQGSKKQRLTVDNFKLKKQYVDQELENIFIIKQKAPSQHKLKQITLNFLSKQKRKLNGMIWKKNLQTKKIQFNKRNLQSEYRIKETKIFIQNKQNQNFQLKNQLNKLKWQKIGQLKKTKTLQKYLKTILTHNKFLHDQKIYQFAYGGLISQIQLKILSLVKKWRFNRKKLVLRKIKYRKLWHMMEVQTLKIQKKKFIKLLVYQIEKGSQGINTQIEITQNQYLILKEQPFYIPFSVKNKKLIRFNEQIKQKGWICIMHCLKFMKRLQQKNIEAKPMTINQKRSVKITYDFKKPVFEAILFITITEQVQDHLNLYSSFAKKYLATIQQVSMTLYKNPQFNFKIYQKVSLLNNFITDKQLNDIVISYFDNIWKQKIDKIIKLQTNFRRVLAKKKSIQLRKTINVTCYHSKKCLFTLLLSKRFNTFTIQNFQTNTMHVENGVKINNLKFMDKIITKVNAVQNCKEKYKIIEKYIKMKQFATKLFSRAKSLNFFTDFQTDFHKKLCFLRKFDMYLFRGKFIQGKILFVVTVQSFQIFPRPYTLRVYTYQSNTFEIDAKVRIFNKQKIFLEEKLSELNYYLQIKSKKQIRIRQTAVNILQDLPIQKLQIRKSSLLSQYSWKSVEDSPKIKRANNRKQSRYGVQAKNRDFRQRHKSILKQSQVMNFRKWMAENDVKYQQSSISSKSINDNSDEQQISSK